MSTKVLVTEAGSALGQAIAAQLAEHGEISVTLTDRTGAPAPGVGAAAGIHRCDFLPDEATEALVAGVDVVVHLVGHATGGLVDPPPPPWAAPPPRPPAAPLAPHTHIYTLTLSTCTMHPAATNSHFGRRVNSRNDHACAEACCTPLSF